MKKFDDWERRVWFAFALLGCMGLLVFLATTAQLYWQKGTATDFWDLATAVFGFFGTLMTAGAAFATAAAVISYFSVNDKLREARSSLEEFQAIDQKRKVLEENIKEMEKYKTIVQDLEKHDSTEANKRSSIEAAKQILESPHTSLESRLKARAIVSEEDLRQKFKDVKSLSSEEQSKELISGRSDISEAWKILFLSAPQKAGQLTRNYAASLFNQAAAIQMYGDYLKQQGNIPQALKNWREAVKKYVLSLDIMSGIDENLIQPKSAYNCGNALDAEAQALAAKNFLSEAMQLWQQAGEKYALALEIKSDKHEAANNWGIVLSCEARAVANQDLTEARRLWQQAGEKFALALKIKPDAQEAKINWWNSLKREFQYIDADQIENFWSKKLDQVLELQKESPAHQSSTVIQDLMEKIRNQLKPKSS